MDARAKDAGEHKERSPIGSASNPAELNAVLWPIESMESMRVHTIRNSLGETLY